VQHVVLVKFKSSTSPGQITQCFEDIGRLRQAIPGIEGYSWGPNNSPEGLNQGYTHGFVMTFKNAAARDAYLPHPAHEKLKAAVLPLVESVLVFDY